METKRRVGRGAGLSLLLLALAFGVPTGTAAQVVEGRVLDVLSGAGVAAATVAVVEPAELGEVRVETDSTGAFRLALPRALTVRFSVEALAYATATTEPLEIGSQETVTIEIPLSAEALTLTPIVVSARRRAPTSLRDFERRRVSGEATGVGEFLVRTDLEREFNVAAPIARIAGFPRSYDARGNLIVGNRTCPGAVFLNGMLVGNPGLDEFVYPTDLEGIEVYRRRSELPVELRSQVGSTYLCSAVVLWTRQGDVTSGGNRGLRFGLFGALIGGFVALFLFN